MIKFVTEEVEKAPKFIDVEIDQFFVDMAGMLCQKTTYSQYAGIADHQNNPHSIRREAKNKDFRIKRILPKVTNIEF